MSMKYSRKRGSARDFDAVAGLEFRVFYRAGFDLFDGVAIRYQAMVCAFARDLRAVFLTRGAAGGEDGLKQCDSGLKGLLAGIVDADADVIELLRAVRDGDHVPGLNVQVQGRGIAEM